MWVGYCITAWAEVDDVLFCIFRDCVGPSEQCAIIYYKTPGLEARFSLIDEIVRSVLPKKSPGEHDHPNVLAWNKAIKDRDELLGTRRRIAHHPVAVRMDIYRRGTFNSAPFGRMPIGATGAAKFSWVELYMSSHEKMRGRRSDLPPLRLEDLKKHYDEVGTMAARLLGFLINALSKPKEISSQPVSLPK